MNGVLRAMMSARPGSKVAFVADAGAAILLRVCAAGANYGCVVLLAKSLPTADYGRYGTIMSALLILGVISLGGNDVTVTRFLGRYEEHAEPGLARGLVSRARRATLTGSVGLTVIGLVLLAGAGLLGKGGDALLPYVIALPILIPYTLMDVQSAVLRTHREMISALAPRDVLWRFWQIVMILGCAFFFAPRDRLIPFLILALAGITLLCVIQALRLRHVVPAAVSEAVAVEDLPAWRRSARANWVLMTARTSFRSLDVIAVSAVLSLSAGGLYFAVSRTSELMGFVLASLNTVMGPSISRAAARDDPDNLRDILGLGSLVVFLPSLTLFVIYIVFGKLILGFFGARFVAAYPALLLFGAGQLVNAAVGSAGVSLNMMGYERVNAAILLVAAPLNLGLVILLAGLFGINGAAFASATGMIAWNIALWIAARRCTGFDTSIFSTLGLFRRHWRRFA